MQLTPDDGGRTSPRQASWARLPVGSTEEGEFFKEGRLEAAALWALPVPAAGHAVCVAPGTLAFFFSGVSLHPQPTL